MFIYNTFLLFAQTTNTQPKFVGASKANCCSVALDVTNWLGGQARDHKRKAVFETIYLD